MNKRKITQRQAQRIQAKQKAFTHALHPSTQEGLVITCFGKTLLLEAPNGLRYRCHCRQHLPQPVAGDVVTWHEALTPKDHGVVVAVAPRRTLITRERPHYPVKPLAANATQMIIMVAPHPAPTPLIIDSYLVSAQAVGLTPLIVFNKMEHSTPLCEQLIALYSTLGYRVLSLSFHQQQGMESLTSYLHDHTSIVVGQSGVGKSSLVQALLPHETHIAIAPPTHTEEAQGRHTTVKTQLYHLLPRGQLIDSPGVRQFSLGTLKLQQLEAGFKDIAHFAAQCRFRNCQHHKEPQCAVKKALGENALPPSRWESYCHLKTQESMTP